jgi:hypothetical protein
LIIFELNINKHEMKPTIYKQGAPEGAEILPENGKTFTLQELYKLLGCEMVQVVPLWQQGKDAKLPYQILICDEEAKLHDGWRDNINEAATKIWNDYYGDTDLIVGTVIVCKPEYFD